MCIDIYTYVCSHFVQVVAAVAQACCSYHRAPYCANAKGLPVSGYFEHYKWGIQHIQRWRPVNVNLTMIRTLNSWLLRVVLINSLEGKSVRTCYSGHRLSGCGSPPEEMHNTKDAIPECAAWLQSLHTCLSFAY